MAAAEAQAVWQRAANRCFVQEDAERAPKLAYCPSSRVQSESSCNDTSNVPNHVGTTFFPISWNPTSFELPPNTKWLLQRQSSFAYQKPLSHEKLDSLPELEWMRNGDVISISKHSKETVTTEEYSINLGKSSGTLVEPHWNVSVAHMKQNSDTRIKELKAVNNNKKALFHKEDIDDYDYGDELMDWESVDPLISSQPKKSCLDLKEPWTWVGGIEPWWKSDNEDDLASLVAHKSIMHIENSDLPQPQTVQIQRGSFSSSNSFGILSTPTDEKTGSDLFNTVEYAKSATNPRCMVGTLSPSTKVYHSFVDSEKPSSDGNSTNTSPLDQVENSHTFKSDQGKAQLLEALCHSQTRAREAEQAAQKAYSEKEHIIKLFFKQASHLFAY